MNKSEILIKLSQQKCVVVVRGNSKSEGFNASKACIEGGIKAIEVPTQTIMPIRLLLS